MTVSPENRIIHVSLIDEFLAARLVECGVAPLSFSVRRVGHEGSISIAACATVLKPGAGEGVDFELSPCECRGLDPEDPAVYLGRPVYTGSAYELFDFMLGYFSSFDCFIEFTGNAWRVSVENAR